ncbi:hypothetical protein GCM10010140_24780 [Streptosporangium pseudovulgare]|uniref:Uncharacterized protein n=1 Tax=Streptosporangium pseudovulgare TaxID=35765 RepID=A0ABQ2QT11_9ACTN|nr:hypothetical protein GCM10010140_24780 [Streptosporangium pseudovulgare]
MLAACDAEADPGVRAIPAAIPAAAIMVISFAIRLMNMPPCLSQHFGLTHSGSRLSGPGDGDTGEIPQCCLSANDVLHIRASRERAAPAPVARNGAAVTAVASPYKVAAAPYVQDLHHRAVPGRHRAARGPRPFPLGCSHNLDSVSILMP